MGKLNINELENGAVRIVEPDFSYIDGKYLRQLRMKMKMSQALLADYLGVSKKAIEKWEQGKNNVNPVVARMLFLFENEPSILSMLKQVKIEGNIVEIKPFPVFEAREIYNENKIQSEIDAKINDFEENNKWNFKNNRNKGALYGAASI